MPDTAMRTWALKGAEQRLLEISEETAAIYRTFSELRDRGNGSLDGPRRGRPRKAVAEAESAPRRKRTMSAEARKRISDAQKARWAKQKGSAKDTEVANPDSRKSSRKKK